MLPEVAGKKPVRRLKQVVLPAPLGPISAWMVPRRTRKSTPLTATKPRNSFDRPRVSRITSEASGTRLLSRKAASRASTGALERCDSCASSPALRLTSRGYNDTTAFIRSICLAALLCAGTAYAQSDNQDNPHSTSAKDKQGTSTPNSVTNDQTQSAESANPHAVNNRDDASKPQGNAEHQMNKADAENPDDINYKNRQQNQGRSDMDTH